MTKEQTFVAQKSIDSERGQTTYTIEIEGRPITIVLTATARENTLRVTLPSGAMLGEVTRHDLQGEVRRHARFPGKSSCIQTVRGHEGGWQLAHSHAQIHEHYFIESGRVCLVKLLSGKNLRGVFYGPGEEFSVQPHVIHTLYVFAKTTFVTTKCHGPTNDWIAAPELDTLTHLLSEEGLLRRFRT